MTSKRQGRDFWYNPKTGEKKWKMDGTEADDDIGMDAVVNLLGG